ncbi:hypothetical protein [Streptomyces nigrescens]|uniref:Uncharacterized protein n=1 Tax=Streptomyces nigrescens TaxID=1920 RepID=A0A640TA05_STRNI|nr:hypothetical protein [Streptomyces libani]WAT94855.1 hypothetical protein STRLI_000526 [Streptomyces libani subsp. libani]GFE20000.1 hypothetical protein Sliba_04530 [Streptomyces libani subsp. libani]GGV85512.1 hypothetical protein GCM10010500_02060 [Streptomyces libani subsp. libani]
MSDESAKPMAIDHQKLEEVAREQLVLLWGDLERARCSAINGKWSMMCDSLVERIKSLTPLVGPTPWEEIQIPLLELGIYQQVHAELGIPVDVDMERVAKTRESIDGRRERARICL